MLRKSLLVSLIGLMLLGAPAAIAQMSVDHAMPHNAFQHLEQPLSLKIGVTIGGLALIGLELWWFLGSRPLSKRAKTDQGVQAVKKPGF